MVAEPGNKLQGLQGNIFLYGWFLCLVYTPLYHTIFSARYSIVMASKATIDKSPVKKSSKVRKGQLQLSTGQKTYIKRFKVGETDPCLLINWFDDKVKTMLRKLSGGKIPNMPATPAYINVQNMK